MGDRPIVIVVDDDPDARTALAREIHAATGADVIAVATVGEACRMMRLAHPDLVIADVIMPHGGGRAVAVEAACLGVPCRLVSSMPPASAAMAERVAAKIDAARMVPGWLADLPRGTVGHAPPVRHDHTRRRVSTYAACVALAMVAPLVM